MGKCFTTTKAGLRLRMRFGTVMCTVNPKRSERKQIFGKPNQHVFLELLFLCTCAYLVTTFTLHRHRNMRFTQKVGKVCQVIRGLSFIAAQGKLQTLRMEDNAQTHRNLTPRSCGDSLSDWYDCWLTRMHALPGSVEFDQSSTEEGTSHAGTRSQNFLPPPYRHGHPM